MYCGNNLLRNDHGSRYSCMRKGIYFGKESKSFEMYISNVEKDKVYCGNKTSLPNGYKRMGNLAECIQKGYGLGMNMAFMKNLDLLISDIDSIIYNWNSRN